MGNHVIPDFVYSVMLYSLSHQDQRQMLICIQMIFHQSENMVTVNVSVRTAQEELTVISVCSRDVERDRMERIGYNSNVFQAPQ